MKSLLMLLVLAALAGSAQAQDTPIPHRFKPNQFPQVVDMIEQEMGPGGLYADIKPEDQATVRKTMARMAEALEGHRSISELSEEQKVQLINDQELVNALLTGNMKEQVVCARRELPGTHIHQNVCETKNEAQIRRERSRDSIREMEQRNPAYSN